MRQEGYSSSSLKESINKSIWGGRTVEIQYCSSSTASMVTLGEDTTNHTTAILVTYVPLSASAACRTDLPAASGTSNWTAGCPVELLP